MHDLTLTAAGAWMAVLLGLGIIGVIRAPTLLSRILALDTLSYILVALLALLAYATNSSYYLDSALVLALLSFVGTLAAARYRAEGRVF